MLTHVYHVLVCAHCKPTSCLTNIKEIKHFSATFLFLLGCLNKSQHGSFDRLTDVFVFFHLFIMLFPLFQRAVKGPKVHDVLVFVLFACFSIGRKLARVKTLWIVLFVVFPAVNHCFESSIGAFVDLTQFAVHFVVGPSLS